MYSVEELLEMALNEVNFLNFNEEFIVKDLFKGYEWKRLPINKRLLLGTLFLNAVEKDTIKIVPMGKTPSGQQKYQRK